MKWFKHSSTMRHDPKVRRVLRKYGAAGYALYCYMLESISEGLSDTSPVPVLEENSEDIAEILRIDSRLVEEMVQFMVGQKLFGYIENTDAIIAPKIIDHMDEYSRKQGQASPIRKALLKLQEADRITYLEAPVEQWDSNIIQPAMSEPKPGPNVVDRLIAVWNSHEELPQYRFTSLNIGAKAGEVLRVAGAYTFEELSIGIGLFARYRKKAIGAGEKVAETFDRWMAASVDRWLDTEAVEARYESAWDDDELLKDVFKEEA